MFLSWLRKLAECVHRNNLRTRRDRQKYRLRKFPRQIWTSLALEELEDRTLLTTYAWTGLGGDSLWNDPNNWGGAGFPNAIGDVANFTGTYSAAQTVVVNQPITVGTIDFGTASNI